MKMLIENAINMYTREYPDLYSIEKPFKFEDEGAQAYTNMSKVMVEV